MTYKHLCIEERAVIAFLIRHGESVRSAAKAIGRNPSTVSREIRRNPASATPCSKQGRGAIRPFFLISASTTAKL